jgi:hypothetical protein
MWNDSGLLFVDLSSDGFLSIGEDLWWIFGGACLQCISFGHFSDGLVECEEIPYEVRK